MDADGVRGLIPNAFTAFTPTTPPVSVPNGPGVTGRDVTGVFT